VHCVEIIPDRSAARSWSCREILTSCTRNSGTCGRSPLTSRIAPSPRRSARRPTPEHIRSRIAARRGRRRGPAAARWPGAVRRHAGPAHRRRRRQLHRADGAGLRRLLGDRHAGPQLAGGRAGQDAGRPQGNDPRGHRPRRDRARRDPRPGSAGAPRPNYSRRPVARPTSAPSRTTSCFRPSVRLINGRGTTPRLADRRLWESVGLAAPVYSAGHRQPPAPVGPIHRTRPSQRSHRGPGSPPK
jgi:hypothetical protein